jgi:hypothetical protein
MTHPESQIRSRVTGTLIGAAAGTLCSLVFMATGLASFLPAPLIGAAFGALLGFFFATRSANPGAGLIWGLGYSFLLWLIPAGILPIFFGTMLNGGMLPTARTHFPQLVA